MSDRREITRLLLGAGEPRPDSYPEGVPFLGELSAVVTWDAGAGLSVKWTMPGFEDRFRALTRRVKERGTDTAPSEVTELAGRLVGASPEERKRQLLASSAGEGSPLKAWALELFGDLPRTGLPDDALGALQEIVRFHVDSGWTVLEGAASAAGRRYEMTKGSAVRQVYAVSILGITTIDLYQRP